MAGGKLHGEGGRTGHQSREIVQRAERRERTWARILRQQAGRMRKPVKRNTRRAVQLIRWGSAQVKQCLALKEENPLEHRLRLLAIDAVLFEGLPRQRVQIGRQARKLVPEERHLFGRTLRSDLVEAIADGYHWSLGRIKKTVAARARELAKTLPKPLPKQ